MKALGYLRVSTVEQADSGLGLAAQKSRLEEEAARRGWELELVTDDGYTAGNLDRPGITRALEELRAGRAQVLVAAKLDRLSRSLLDFAGLMERSRRERWALVALDLGLDTASPSGELMASVLASFAQYERRLISARTADALAAKKRQGYRLGRPVTLPDTTRQTIKRLRSRGWSLPRIAAKLNAEGVPTARGGREWRSSSVLKVLRSLTLDAEAKAALREAAA